MGLRTSEWERSRRPTPGGGVLLEQRQDWGGAGKGSWGDMCGT